MKLIDLSPRWASDGHIAVGGGKILESNVYRSGMAISFICPCCHGTDHETHLVVFFANPIDGGAPSADHLLWQRQGDDFNNLTLSPSVDASKHGHWHGFIKNGEVL